MVKNEKLAFISASLLLIPLILSLFFNHFILIFSLLFIILLLILGGIYEVVQISPLLKKQGIFLIIFGLFIVGWYLIVYIIISPFNLVDFLFCLILGLVFGCAFFIPGIYYVKNYKRFHEKYGTRENALGIIFLVIGLYFLFSEILYSLPFISSTFIIVGIVLIRKKLEEDLEPMQTNKVICKKDQQEKEHKI